MPTIQFVGRVLPRGLECSLSGIPEIEWYDSERDTRATFSITVKSSRVTASCRFQEGEEPPFIAAYMRALDLAKAAVDTAAFMTGSGLTVVLEDWINAQGVRSEIQFVEPQLAALATVFQRPNGLDEVLRVVLADHPTFHALNDLILAITVPHHSPVNCARVVESIRHMIAGQGTEAKTAWPQMRQALNVDENYLKLIMGTSTAPRHGQPVPPTAQPPRAAVPGGVSTTG